MHETTSYKREPNLKLLLDFVCTGLKLYSEDMEIEYSIASKLLKIDLPASCQSTGLQTQLLAQQSFS